MDNSKVRDEIKRMEHHEKIEKSRLIIAQYEKGFAHYREEIEKNTYEIGKLDERLEGRS